MTNGVWDWFKGILAALGGVAAFLWGPWDTLIIALIACASIDVLTGFIKAFYLQKASSKISFRGIAKKMVMFLLVGLAAVIDYAIPATNGALRAAVIIFYIANEGLSILENAGELGLPLPSALKKALAALKKQSGEETTPDK